MRRAVWIVGIAAAAAGLGLLFLASCGCGGNTLIAAARFSAIRDDHTALRAFLRAMPKGADLHVHLSGAVYAERLMEWAKDKNFCFDLTAQAMTDKCGTANTPPIADAFDPKNRNAQPLYDRMVNALSMRFFLPQPSTPSAHDQFFAAFGRFGAITWLIPAEMTAAMLKHYAADNVQHTELMATLLPYTPGQEMLASLKGQPPGDWYGILEPQLRRTAVPIASQTIDGWVQSINQILGCSAQRSEPGCGVSYRFIAQVNRNADPADVFMQTAFAAMLVRMDKRVAGLNFVGPEDYRIARTDYRRHMGMIGFLAKGVPVALHAGELWGGLVPPEDLTFHITQAVEVAGARRIGHGVALAYEKDNGALLETMRAKKVAVEINLTSNDLILGVRGNDHPLMAYRAARVPTVISTDDMGVARIDLSNEYFRAARDYPLGYRELKRTARNSIEYSFLSDSEKTVAFRQFDKAMAAFEKAVAAERGLLRNIGTVIASLFRWP